MSENVAASYPSLLRTVLGDVVKIISSDNDCAGHLRRDNTAGEDTATDRDVTGEGALLVYPTKPQAIVNPGIRTLSILCVHAPM